MKLPAVARMLAWGSNGVKDLAPDHLCTEVLVGTTTSYFLSDAEDGTTNCPEILYIVDMSSEGPTRVLLFGLGS